MNLAKKLLLTASSRGLAAAGTFGLNVVLARNLTISEFGNFSVCLVAVITITIFSKFGFDTSLLRFGGAAWHREQFDLYIRYCMIALLGVTGISLGALAITEFALTVCDVPWAAADLFRLTMLSMPFLSISGIVASCLKAAHRPETGSLFEMGGASLLACLVLLGAASLGYTITAEYAAKIFVWTSVVFCGLSFACLSWTLWDRRKKQPRKQKTTATTSLHQDDSVVCNALSEQSVSLSTYWMTSLDFFVVAGAQVLGNWSGVFFLEYFADDTATAVFSAARRTSLFPLLLISVVVSIFSPKLAGLHAEGNHVSFKKMVHRSSLVVCLVNVPMLLLMAFGAPWWMALFGKAYQTHWLILALMSIGQLSGAVTGIATGVMGMTGHQQQLRKISIVSAVMATMLAAILSATWGVVGAAIAAAAYATGQSMLIAWAVRQQLGYWPLPALK